MIIIKNYAISAWRNLMKRKGFSLINIVGLAVGMASALLILTYVTYEFSFDKMHTKSDRIFRVESTFYEGKELTDRWATSSFGYGSAMKAELSGIEDYTRVATQYQQEQIVKYGNLQCREQGIAYTDPAYFRIFDFEVVKGNRDKLLNMPNQVVITERVAKKYFKDTDPIGKILIFTGGRSQVACEVTGVMKEMPGTTHVRYNFLISYGSLPQNVWDYWYKHEVYTYVLLENGKHTAQVEAAFPQMAEKYKTDEALKNKTWAVELKPLTDIHLSSQLAYEAEAKGNKGAMIALIVAAIAILCIAWINYVNLTVARSMERAKEVAIRRVVGATRKQLVTQFLFESLLTNLLSFVVAVGIMEVVLPAFNQMTGIMLSLSVWGTTYMVFVVLLVLLMGIFLSGFYPAVILSGIKPIRMLKGKFTHTRGAGMVRKVLVVVQYSASMILLCATFIVFAQLNFMRSASLGIKTDQTLIVKFPGYTDGLATKLQTLKRELAALPSVRNVTVSGAIPGEEVGMYLSIHRKNDPLKQNRLYEMLDCDPDFLTAYDLKILAGRIFAEDYGSDNLRLVINEAAVKNLGFASNEAAIGQLISVETVEEPMQIIGVVNNYHQQALSKDYTPIMFFLHEAIPWMSQRYISVVMKSGNPQDLIGKIEKVWNRYFADSSFDYFFLDQYFDRQYHHDEVFGVMVSLFVKYDC